MAKRTREAIRNLGRAIDWTAASVRDAHLAIAKQPYRVLSHVPIVGEGAAVVEAVHLGVTKGTYAAVRAVAKGVVAAVEEVVAIADLPDPSFDDKGVVAVMNAVAGHALDLGVSMSFVSEPPSIGAHVVIFVHGLGADETCWSWYAKDGTTYGSRLHDALGVTPLFVRYNTGLDVEHNGVALADLIEKLVETHDVSRISLVGHSMGGLVIGRAVDEKRAFNERISHVVCLGSPHLGAPLAKLGAGAAIALASFEATMPFSRILESRSAGVKALVNGYARATELPHARVLLVMSAGLGLLGDGLVRVESASGVHHHERVVIERGHHGLLLNDPEVYEHLERFLGP